MTDAPNNLVRVSFGQQSEIKDPLVRRCSHKSYELDAEDRTVHCGTCGAQLNAFQVLLDYADGERNWRGWDTECERKRKELAELHEEERKVKARTKAALRKDADAAVAAERARSERERIGITRAARDIAKFARRIEQLTQRRRSV